MIFIICYTADSHDNHEGGFGTINTDFARENVEELDCDWHKSNVAAGEFNFINTHSFCLLWIIHRNRFPKICSTFVEGHMSFAMKSTNLGANLINNRIQLIEFQRIISAPFFVSFSMRKSVRNYCQFKSSQSYWSVPLTEFSNICFVLQYFKQWSPHDFTYNNESKLNRKKLKNSIDSIPKNFLFSWSTWCCFLHDLCQCHYHLINGIYAVQFPGNPLQNLPCKHTTIYVVKAFCGVCMKWLWYRLECPERKRQIIKQLIILNVNLYFIQYLNVSQHYLILKSSNYFIQNKYEILLTERGT